MKTIYTDQDIKNGHAWYAKHKEYVDTLLKGALHSYPMSGSDISKPELWKPAAWKWFLETYPNL